MSSSADAPPGPRAALGQLLAWPARRWWVAAAAAVGFFLLVAVPTDLIDTPVFGREVPPTWWAAPSLALSSMLGGLLVATYVSALSGSDRAASRRGGWLGGFLTYVAVGCPVCNKLVLLVLGSAGAMTWFEPVQPLLQVGAVGLLLWALWVRLQGERSCPVAPGVMSS